MTELARTKTDRDLDLEKTELAKRVYDWLLIVERLELESGRSKTNYTIDSWLIKKVKAFFLHRSGRWAIDIN